MIDHDWLPTALAGANSSVQAAFLNTFCSALVGICKRLEGQQIWHIAADLDASAVDLLKELVASREHHAEQYRQDQLRRDDLRKEIAALEAQKRALQDGSEL